MSAQPHPEPHWSRDRYTGQPVEEQPKRVLRSPFGTTAEVEATPPPPPRPRSRPRP